MVALPDGSSFVDIKTTEGANAFLEGLSSHGFFTSKLEEIRKLRKKESNNKQLNAHDEMKLDELYEFIVDISRCADQETFQAKILESEIHDWLDYIIVEIESFTKRKNWIHSGVLLPGDLNVLKFFRNAIGNYVVPIDLIFESTFLQVLANFIEARKGNGRALPCEYVCDIIFSMVSCILELAIDRKGWTTEKTFKKFESSGILQQLLRCSTVPAIGPGLDNFFVLLGCCTRLVTRKFKIGEPCGDTLKAILDGRDGSTNIQPEIRWKLQGIARLVEYMDLTDYKASLVAKCISCSKTGTLEAPLLCCSRCRVVWYCSRECQRAHWKIHKVYCKKLTAVERDRSMSLRMALDRFVEQSLEAVLEEVVKRSIATGLEANDLTVELNFMPNAEGIIPALQVPPIFEIVPTRDYISGQKLPQFTCGKPLPDPVKRELEQTSSCTKFLLFHAGRVSVRPTCLQEDN